MPLYGPNAGTWYWSGARPLGYEAWSEGWSQEFGSVWARGIGQPFYACVYCGGHHLDPKTRPHCVDEKFVRGVLYQFPMLRRDSPGLTPWKPEKWARWWRTSGARTSGSGHAVAFVLSVWAGSNDDFWKRRGWSFDAVRALGAWDAEHRAAFMAWCQRPWWP